MILHIPHSSTHFPNKDGFIASPFILEQEITRLTDWYTDELFNYPNCNSVKASFSRIFCDVERFEDDTLEEMSKFGMGVLYEYGDCRDRLRFVSPTLRTSILTNYYHPYHAQLEKVVANELSNKGSALIIDCHSFPQIPLKTSHHSAGYFPDFGIGTDSFHTPTQLVYHIVNFLQAEGYSIGIDIPYRGCIVPHTYYKKEARVYSIMIEINRRLYLDEKTRQKLPEFEKIGVLIKSLLREIENFQIKNEIDF